MWINSDKEIKFVWTSLGCFYNPQIQSTISKARKSAPDNTKIGHLVKYAEVFSSLTQHKKVIFVLNSVHQNAYIHLHTSKVGQVLNVKFFFYTNLNKNICP